MKKILLIIGLAISNLLATAQQANVTIDPNFNIGSGFNGGIFAMVLQSDGKIVVGGNFTSFNGISGINRLARLNIDGSLDTEFASNIGYGFNNTVRTIALQQDGGLLVGGDFTEVNTYSHNHMTRLDSTGTVDWYLCQNMGIGFGNNVNTIVLQPDGKILVGGKFESYHVTTRYCFIRLNPDLTVDPLLIAGIGYQNSDFPSLAYVDNICLFDDGKIAVSGNFNKKKWTSTVTWNCYQNFDIITPNDYFLGADFNSPIKKMFLKSNGDLLVGGGFSNVDGISTLPLGRIINNYPDYSYSPINIDVASYGANFFIEQLNNKIIVGGNSFYRLTSNHQIDNTFNVGTGFNNEINAMALQQDGKILVAGGFSSYNGTTVNGLVRLIEGTYNNPNPNNCLATYPFNGNTNDESGNNYNATNNGAVSTMDRNGNSNKAYDFNGTSNYIQFPSAIGTGITTVSLWFKPTSSQDNQIILRNRMYGYEVAYNKVYDGTDRTNKLSTKLYINNSSSSYSEYTYIHPTNLNLNQWYHIAFTYDGNYYRVYLNNILVYQSNSFGLGTVKYENSGAGYVIGRDGDTPYWYFKGSIDDFSVWGRALSGSELNTIYTGGTLNSANFESNKNMILYPNPVKDILQIKILESTNITNCELFDISGKIIKVQIFNNSIDVSQIQKGMYLIKLETNEGNFTEKFIKE